MTTPTTPRAPFSLAGAARGPGNADDAEAELVRRAARGDVAAIATILKRLEGPVASIARRILGRHRADADDATQQTFIALVRALPSYRGESSVAAFAKTIAVRTALALRRRSRARAQHVDEEQEAGAQPSLSPSPNDDALAEARRAMLRRLLGEIPPEQAEALAMRIVLGWSLEEISRHAGVPSNTVRSRIRLAKEALRRRIEAAPELRDALAPDDE